ncbi:MAG: ATP-binding cassette domain-containing protein [Trueperaceae bacterium]|nr:ATP-binding cassette domain-containing protein [Trueperaceae bacterium]
MVIHPGEMVCLLGGNASGKSTTLKTVLGIVGVSEGRGALPRRASRHPDHRGAHRARHGGRAGEPPHLPEDDRAREPRDGRLPAGTIARRSREDMDYVVTLFPRIGERLGQQGGTMSGGEQQMLAMGRALMSRPKLILMDEPSMGLAPLFVEKIFEIIKTVNDEGISVFVVEQNANVALSGRRSRLRAADRRGRPLRHGAGACGTTRR